MRGLQLLLLLLCSAAAMAGVEYRKFKDTQTEQTYNILIEELRCLVCQNQTIADSNAALAKDLRRQVYEMLQQGQSQAEIAAFMVQRYGDFVLYKPPFKAKTGVLWIAPWVFLAIGFAWVLVLSKKRTRKQTTAASPQHAKAKRLLAGEDEP